ncbi:MAG TPA: isoprenylcysteine carboxylmethyltransferase family protein [Steroidobacteraceae bacterium]|nr:isoprenylcysteine carboxylmethyltransferase family protein [Steroidobacteraceae bacterium]
MTRSASTPRLRATQLVYLLLLLSAAFVGPRGLSPGLDLGLRVTGLVLVAGACLGRIWCSAFIAGQKDAALVQTGPYSIVRHPLYILSFVAVCGLALASRSWLLGLLAVVTVTTLLLIAARVEERFLATKFARDWPAYRAGTSAWWPRIGAYRLPERLSVQPGIYWKAFLDAGAMLVLLALVDTAATLRIAAITPQWLPTP